MVVVLGFVVVGALVVVTALGKISKFALPNATIVEYSGFAARTVTFCGPALSPLIKNTADPATSLVSAGPVAADKVT